MKTDTIQDFIVTDERNLRIAAAIAEAWPKAREQLVSSFLKRLHSNLEPKLGGWDHVLWKQFFVDPYPAMYLWKPSWKDQYSVAFQCSNHGEEMVFGVQRDETYIKKRPFCAEILSAVRKLHPSAHARTWWEAVVTMQSPAADWRKPEVLWRMHKDEKFINDVAEQLLEVAQATEAIIDRLVQKQ
jgi:hypothetical protein